MHPKNLIQKRIWIKLSCLIILKICYWLLKTGGVFKYKSIF